MKLNYYLKSVSVVVSAIAMLLGSASLAQAESLTSNLAEDSAIASNPTNQPTADQAQASVSTRAVDLLTVDDFSLAASELEQTPSASTEYSLTPISAAEYSTLDNADAAPTDEMLLIDSDMAQADPLEMDMNGMVNSPTGNATDNAAEGRVSENGTPPEISDTSEATVNDGSGETVAQVITPGRATRSGASYVGIGGNIGLGDGETALGEGSFAAFSKIGLTRNISVRPSILINDNPTILLPVTFDFIPGVTQVTENVSEEVGLRISPFVGAGAAISTGDDGSVDFLATAGVDVPLGRRFTGVAAVNASLFDDPAVGLMLGVGINFPALR